MGLQARVDPQLLFGVLDAVADRQAAGQPVDALLDALIAFLRSALPEAGRDGSTLGRECDVAVAWLALMQAWRAPRLAWRARDERLAAYERSTGRQIAVLVVQSLEGARSGRHGWLLEGIASFRADGPLVVAFRTRLSVRELAHRLSATPLGIVAQQSVPRGSGPFVVDVQPNGHLRLRGVLARTALSEYQLDELALRWRPAARRRSWA